MNEMKRVLIGSVELDKTKSGKPVANLWSTDTRLQFPALRLFDLSALTAVGIDPNSLGTERIHRRLWAYYTEGDKKTSTGRPYLNVEYLEAIDAPATTTSTAVGDPEVLAELRSIRDYLALLVEAQGLDPHRDRPSDIPDQEPNGNGHDEPAPPQPQPATQATIGPMGATKLLEQLQAEGLPFQNVGHLLYGIRRQLGDQGWGWPVTTDTKGWAEAIDAARGYGETL